MSSLPALSVRIGNRLCGLGGKGVCTLGCFAKKVGGPTLALTVWHAFARETNSDVRCLDDPTRIGSLLPNHEREKGRAPFWTAIGLVRLDPGIEVAGDMPPNERPPALAAGMDGLLGRAVHRFGDPSTIGCVTATHGILHLKNPLDGRVITYDDTLEITFNADLGLVKGDAGCLVVTQSGEGVGLIVAGGNGACYVAPLEPLLRERNLNLTSPVLTDGDVVRGCNRRISEKMHEEEGFYLGEIPRAAA